MREKAFGPNFIPRIESKQRNVLFPEGARKEPEEEK
jgi:hypothetical protein